MCVCARACCTEGYDPVYVTRSLNHIIGLMEDVADMRVENRLNFKARSTLRGCACPPRHSMALRDPLHALWLYAVPFCPLLAWCCFLPLVPFVRVGGGPPPGVGRTQPGGELGGVPPVGGDRGGPHRGGVPSWWLPIISPSPNDRACPCP